MTTRVYKLTNQDNKTLNDMLWGDNVSHETSGDGELCGPVWLHAYTDKLLAVFLNPIHGRFKNPKLWIAFGNGKRKDDNGLKVGFTTLTTGKEVPLPVVNLTQHIAFGILCVLEFYTDKDFTTWAEKWLSGKCRSVESANVAYAAFAAADAGAASDAVGVANAALAAAYAAYAANAALAAAYAAYAAYAANVAADAAAAANVANVAADADAAAAAVYAANSAANAAAYAAYAANTKHKNIDLKKIAKKAMKIK